MMKKITVTIFLFCLLISLSPCTGAESLITIREFLATALNDPDLLSQIERIGFLKNDPEGVRFIEDPELRITIDQFEKDQQKYAFRFTPVGLEKINRDRDLQDAMVKSSSVGLEKLFHEALKSRYMTVVDYCYFSEMVALHEKMKLILDDREIALKRYVETPDFDPEELVGVENEQDQLEIDLAELNNMQSALKAKIRAQGNYKEDGLSIIDISRMITVDHIEEQISAIDMSQEVGNIYLLSMQTEAEMAEAEYLVKAAEKDRIITFIEAAYSADDKDDFDKAVSIEFGIPIPVKSGSQADLRKRKIASIKSRGDFHALKREVEQTLPVINRELHNLIQQYKSVRDRKEGRFSNGAFGRLVQIEGSDPLTLLKLKERMVKSDLLITKLSQIIFTKYINILDITGRLSKKPLINYLANQTEVIDK